MVSDVDFAALFAVTASPYLVLRPDLIIVDVNRAYLKATGRARQELLGKHIFNAFPENPADRKAEGTRNLDASLQRVLSSREPDTMALFRYDITAPDKPDRFEERWWCVNNTPVPAPDGSVAWIIHRSEDVTAFVMANRAEPPAAAPPGPDGRLQVQVQALEKELYTRAVEVQQRNEQLRDAQAHDREVAATFQETLLRTPDLVTHHDVAVRYLPASRSLNACGDWYDVVDLPGEAIAVAVGDVIGHGLQAAAVMGMLRSALSAAIRSIPHPGHALEVLGLYARSIEDALGTTVVNVLIDRRSCLIIYSNAGHPPPVLAHVHGRCELLDQATDPPLGARPLHVSRPQASLPYTPGDVLVLYTDGLIERRGEDIDIGISRLIEALTEATHLEVEHLADRLLTRLGVINGGPDDIALVVVRL